MPGGGLPFGMPFAFDQPPPGYGMPVRPQPRVQPQPRPQPRPQPQPGTYAPRPPVTPTDLPPPRVTPTPVVVETIRIPSPAEVGITLDPPPAVPIPPPGELGVEPK